MRLPLANLDRRYGKLRISDAARRCRMLESLQAHEQQVPVVVVPAAEVPGQRFVLIDGYLRVDALEQLHRDEVLAQEWDMPEGRALALAHRLDSARDRTALEEGWLLSTLEREHGMRLGDLSVLLCRSRSWVSRRLALVQALPDPAQEAVRDGRVSAQAAQRYLVPLARANSKQCETLARNLKGDRVSVRQLHTLYVAWRGGDATTRQRLVDYPSLFFAAREAARNDEPVRDEVMHDLDSVIGALSRARRRIDKGVLADSDTSHLKRLGLRCRSAEDSLQDIVACLEEADARLGNTNSDFSTDTSRPRDSSNRQSSGGIEKRGPKSSS